MNVGGKKERAAKKWKGPRTPGKPTGTFGPQPLQQPFACHRSSRTSEYMLCVYGRSMLRRTLEDSKSTP